MRVRSWLAGIPVVLLLAVLFQAGSCLAPDGNPPEVVSVDPDEMPPGWAMPCGFAFIEVYFSEPMNQSSVENSTVITPHTGYSPYEWTNNGTIYKFTITPDQEGPYLITISQSSKDINETMMEAPYSWTIRCRTEDHPAFEEVPIWLMLGSVLFGVLPFVLIPIVWYIHETRERSKLTPEQLKRFKELQPKKIDRYDITILALFAVVMVILAWSFAQHPELSSFSSFLVVMIVMTILFALAQSMSSATRRRMEIEALRFPPIDTQRVKKERSVWITKEIIIAVMILIAMYGTFFIISVLQQRWDSTPLIIIMIIEILLFASYYYISKKGGSKNE